MGFDFPASPALDEVFSPGEASYKWNGYAWRMTNQVAYLEPVLTSITPPFGYENVDTNVQIIGSEFVTITQVVLVDSLFLTQTRPSTTFVNPTELTATLPTDAGTPGGSWLVRLETGVLDSPPPAPIFVIVKYPTLISLTPTSVAAGSADFLLIVDGDDICDGSNNEPISEILWDGVPIPTTVNVNRTAQATITPDAAPGTHEVSLQTGTLVSQGPPLIFTFT